MSLSAVLPRARLTRPLLVVMNLAGAATLVEASLLLECGSSPVSAATPTAENTVREMAAAVSSG